MNVQGIMRLLQATDKAPLTGTVNLFFYDGGAAATRGYTVCIAAAAPTDTVYAKGAMLLKIGGAANEQLYMNEGNGYGASPSWVVIPTP